MLTEEQVARMRAVAEFRDGPTAFRSPEGTIDYLRRRHVDNLVHYCDISRANMLDCGCGEGWNILAFLLVGGRGGIAENDALSTFRSSVWPARGADGHAVRQLRAVTQPTITPPRHAEGSSHRRPGGSTLSQSLCWSPGPC